MDTQWAGRFFLRFEIFRFLGIAGLERISNNGYMALTRIVAVRHGETEWNTQGRFQGHLDSPLTERGWNQAQALAERLNQETFQVVYSSDLERARLTATCIANRCGHKVVLDDRLRERHYGVFQGLRMQEIADQHADAYLNYLEGDPDYAIPGGESQRQGFLRHIGCLNELVARHRGQTLLVVVHGGVLDSLYRSATGMGLELPREDPIPNAGLNVFARDDPVWSMEIWADVAHLAS